MYGRTVGDRLYFILLFSTSLILMGYLIKFFQGCPIGFKLNFSIKDFSPFDRLLSSTLIWLWPLIIASWLIGIFIGLVNNVDPSFVFRNFLGLLVYMIFPVMLIVSPSLKSLISMIFIAGMVQMFYGFVQSYEFMINPAAFYTGLSFTDMRSVYNTGSIVVFPLFTVGAAYQLLPKNYFSDDRGRSENYGQMVSILSKSFIFTFLTLIAIVVPSMSKGFILATATLFLSVVLFLIRYSLKAGRIHKNIVMLLVFLVLLLYLLPSEFYNTIIYSYSLEEESNSVKSEQYKYLIAELTFWGNGLGSSLHSGHAASTKSYAFELTYLNIVHKLGVFSIFLFLSYVITLTVASIRIIKRVYVFESFFVIGLMGYLIVGIGNPILLDSGAVVLHCIAIYILTKPFLRPLKENHIVSPFLQ